MSSPALSKPSIRRQRGVLAVSCLALGTVVSAVPSLNVALPDIARGTGATITQLSWIVDAYALAFAALLLPAGSLGDLWGRRRVLVAGLVLFAVVAPLTLWIDSPTALITVRAVLGVAAALIMPATLSTLTATFAEAERAQAVAIWAGVAGASAILGLLASGIVLVWWSWQAVFMVSAVLAVASLIGTLVVVPESADPAHAAKDPGGAVLSALGMGAVVYSLIEAPTHGWLATETLGGLTLGLALLAAFVLWESVTARPLLPARCFRIPSFTAASLSLTAQFFCFFGFIFLILQYLQFVRGYDALGAALRMLPLPLGLMPMARLSPHLLARWGQARLCGLGLGVIAVSLWALSMIDLDTSYWVIALLFWPLGAGMGLAMPPATTSITDALPRAEQGVASAVNDLSREFGGALGIAVLASVMTSAYQSALHLPAQLPQKLRDLAEVSVAAATRMPDPIAHAARTAFVDGMQQALLVAAIVAAVASVGVAVTLRTRR